MTWFANANKSAEVVPFIPSDFMGEGNREKRVAEQMCDALEVARANSQLARILPGEPPSDEIPEWAR